MVFDLVRKILLSSPESGLSFDALGKSGSLPRLSGELVGYGMVGDNIRESVMGIKNTVAGIDEIVDVEVSDCEGWELLMQLHILSCLLSVA